MLSVVPRQRAVRLQERNVVTVHHIRVTPSSCAKALRSQLERQRAQPLSGDRHPFMVEQPGCVEHLDRHITDRGPNSVLEDRRVVENEARQFVGRRTLVEVCMLADDLGELVNE